MRTESVKFLPFFQGRPPNLVHGYEHGQTGQLRARFRKVVLYGLVKVRSTARSATIGGGHWGGQIAPTVRREDARFEDDIGQKVLFLRVNVAIFATFGAGVR